MEIGMWLKCDRIFELYCMLVYFIVVMVMLLYFSGILLNFIDLIIRIYYDSILRELLMVIKFLNDKGGLRSNYNEIIDLKMGCFSF